MRNPKVLHRLRSANMAGATNTNEGGDLPSTKSYLPEKWTGELVGEMHMKRLTNRELAELTGYTEQYISMVLNGHKTATAAKEKIKAAVNGFGKENS